MKTCPMYTKCFLLSKTDLLMVLKRTIEKMYCFKNYDKCARFKLHQEGIEVPKTLLPNDRECVTLE